MTGQTIPKLAATPTIVGSHGPWASVEVDARFRALFAEDMAFSQIAAELNLEFHTAITRNACVGRAHRLHLPPRRKVTEVRRSTRTIKAQFEETTQRHPLPSAPKRIAKAATAVKDALSEALHCTFAELTPRQCHFPYGDHSPYTFCGLPTARNCSWCSYHSRWTSKGER